jgi:threonine/homoserine/homoserine lactone efflux protein
MNGSIAAFALAALVLTITPGLDTALVLRTAATDGSRPAMGASIGIAIGVFVWGAAGAFGIGALLTASMAAYTALRWAGAIYLVWLGGKMLLRPRSEFRFEGASAGSAWRRGLLTNLLNPKVGLFYVSFLPQFIPRDANPAAFAILLVAIHVVMGLAWFALLIAAMRPISELLRRPAVIRWLDRATGFIFIGFGIRLAVRR